MSQKFTIGVVGNPNSGKSTLFNCLTGGRQKVGNWPGVTVERVTGQYQYEDKIVEIIDLPGIYSLSTSSLDEQIARDFILKDKPDLIINIVDASSLERNLYLTSQLLEMKVPLLVVLNKLDFMMSQKIKIDQVGLSSMLDCPVIGTVANKRDGVAGLFDFIDEILDKPKVSTAHIHYPDEVERAIKSIQLDLKDGGVAHTFDERWLALKLIEGDIRLQKINMDHNLLHKITANKEKIKSTLGEDADIIIADSRYGFIHAICKKVVDRRNVIRRNITDVVDRIILSPIFGLPIFLLAMYLTFWITINFGGCFIDFFDILFQTIFVEGTSALLGHWGAPEVVRTFLADGIGQGITTVSTFIPPIFFIFLCLAFLEDSGYMSRAAFVMDGVMRKIGLPGKAFVPLLVGFGCNVPAIMATRTLENDKDRTLAVLMNPFMSCGARMPVYALFVSVFFPQNGSLIVFALYLIGVLMAIFTALLLKNTILKGEVATFIMELPPYHIPTMRGVLMHTWQRLRSFIVKAGKIIILIIVILTVLNSVTVNSASAVMKNRHSLLRYVGHTLTPLFKPMGIREDNWPAVVGILTGVFAKESVISTLDALYSQIDKEDRKDEANYDFSGGVKKAFMSISDNLAALKLPFSLSGLLGGADSQEAQKNVSVAEDVHRSLLKHFNGRKGAFAYLLMILLYMPCIPAMSAVYQELNLKWMFFSAFYLTSLAWLTATFFYQAATFYENRISSGFWMLAVSIIVTVFVFILKIWGEKINNT